MQYQHTPPVSTKSLLIYTSNEEINMLQWHLELGKKLHPEEEAHTKNVSLYGS